jgi:hypothetical protein
MCTSKTVRWFAQSQTAVVKGQAEVRSHHPAKRAVPCAKPSVLGKAQDARLQPLCDWQQHVCLRQHCEQWIANSLSHDKSSLDACMCLFASSSSGASGDCGEQTRELEPADPWKAEGTANGNFFNPSFTNAIP